MATRLKKPFGASHLLAQKQANSAVQNSLATARKALPKTTQVGNRTKTLSSSAPSSTLRSRMMVSGSSVMPNEFKVGAPKPITPFEQFLPYDKIFNSNLITGIAENQINPEVARAQDQGIFDFERGLGQTGGFRFGMAEMDRKNLLNSFERDRKQRIASFIDSISNLTNDWYNKQKETYYKTPSRYVMPALPTMNNFLTNNPGLANQYNQATNVPLTYNNPLLF